MTFLVVEDNPHMRRLLMEMLRGAHPGRNVLEAADGSTALALCQEHRPDLVLMDIALPDCNGLELTASLKVALPATAVIVVSNRTQRSYREHAMAVGASFFIPKDQVAEALLPAVAACLGDAGRRTTR